VAELKSHGRATPGREANATQVLIDALEGRPRLTVLATVFPGYPRAWRRCSDLAAPTVADAVSWPMLAAM
jgi:hypothetical protein